MSGKNTSLNNKTTVLVVSGFTLGTSSTGQCIQWIRSFKLACYLPISPILGNYHLNNLSRLSGLIRKFAIFYVTDVCFHGNQEKVVRTVAASCFINKLIPIRFIPFWMKNFMSLLRLNWNTFIYFFNFFVGRTPLNTH